MSWMRPLGSTAMKVSALGLGTVKLGRDQGVKYPEGFTIPDDGQARALLAQARDLGINLIDTAPAYGNSEQRLGNLLRGQRDQWLICSKVGEEFDDGVSRFDFPRSTPGFPCSAACSAWTARSSTSSWCIPTAMIWPSFANWARWRPWPTSSARA
jgi:aryl-alcohol dehydrogenase-like predicted oxidoreductase